MLSEIIKIEGISNEAHNALLASGAYHTRRGFDVWCHSSSRASYEGRGTCQCHSHSPGQDWDEYNIPAPCSKAIYHVSPIKEVAEDLRGEFDNEKNVHAVVVLEFMDGRVLETVQEQHWAAETKMVDSGQPTEEQLIQMSRPSVGPWNE